MNCCEFGRNSSDFRDGTDAELAHRMREHAAACGHCRARTWALQIGVDVLRMSEIEPSEGLVQALRMRFEVVRVR